MAVRWSATGTFSGPGSFQGIAPTGQHVTLTGLDLLRVRDGLIVHNDAFTDGLGLARQLGLMPPQGSRADTAMLGAFNAKTRGARRLAGTAAEPVADGVWRVRGGVPRRMNAYLIADAGGGVTVFDTGVRGMGRAIVAAASGLGGINRVVLGHAHVDHRGAANELGGAPVLCHPLRARGGRGRRRAQLREVRAAAAARPGGLPDAVQAVGRRAGHDRRHRRGGRRRVAASAPCSCPATRPGRSPCSASATGSR